MKLYAFDEVDESLLLLPMAARRALDHAGRRLSRAGWLSLDVAARRELTQLGSEPRVEDVRVRALVEQASPAALPATPALDPPADAAPPEVGEAFGQSRPLPAALWSSLSPLDRFALAKVAEKRRPERLAAAYAEIVGASALSTHLSAAGAVRMVDVGPKSPTLRRAVAESFVGMSAEAFSRLEQANVGKGDVLGTARIAGIMAAKRTSELIPLCHALAITHVHVDIELDAGTRRVRLLATVETFDRTGVEMEALCAASVAGLTVYDMLKAYDRAMELGPTRLLAKSGGRSGDFAR
ncbi:MAG: cyclic pyranopterin monophosphate synthase MoaC [Polyangiaceae bacterium]|nr:cyclic pyranopterin monophosphate synthase MoaC [Polyangiaceae bacterium]MCL4752710.1 cyclic pyranopterin monophosphate synthase MoaC [Myxococcales bacterium]